MKLNINVINIDIKIKKKNKEITKKFNTVII